jgi:predicted dehydrogenase
VRITAVCDIAEDHVKLMQKWVVQAGQKEPTGYTRGPRDFERLCETEDLDLVFNATPWEWHVPVCVAAMKNGKHAATEVPAAMTLDDCWQLVEHAEKYGKHSVMMENCNYDRPEMMVFNMVRQGLFGEILHAEGGYLHDLRSIEFANEGEGLWRRCPGGPAARSRSPTSASRPSARTSPEASAASQAQYRFFEESGVPDLRCRPELP